MATANVKTQTRLKAVLAGLGLALVGAGCADDKPLNTFEPRGPAADDLYALMWPAVWLIMILVFVLVVGGGIALSIKNRVDGDTLDPEDLPNQLHGNTKLELAWTAAPALVLVVLSFPAVGAVWRLEERSEGPDEDLWEMAAQDDVDVMVIGQQWWWEFRYDVNGNGFIIDGNGDGVVDDKDRELPLELILDPDDVVTANELVIPADEQVDLILSSRDVIHSFWIPRLNGKRDTVPGRWTTWSLEAHEPGKYTGWCTEFCGLSHARMRMSTIALDKADYEAWFANQALPAEVPTDERAVAGRDLFAANCTSCHVISDNDLEYSDTFQVDVPLVAKAAPNLTHFATRTTFGGGIYATYLGEGTEANDDAFDVANYVSISQLAANPTSADDFRWNTAELKRWVKNASTRKDMHSEANPETGLGRGMLPFDQLTDEELDQIVAYLATLD